MAVMGRKKMIRTIILNQRSNERELIEKQEERGILSRCLDDFVLIG